MPFGSLLIGGIAQLWEPPLAALLSGLACLTVYATINLKTPTVRRFQG